MIVLPVSIVSLLMTWEYRVDDKQTLKIKHINNRFLITAYLEHNQKIPKTVYNYFFQMLSDCTELDQNLRVIPTPEFVNPKFRV